MDIFWLLTCLSDFVFSGKFEYLRSAIPTEDKCAKMSKLSIIKIATSYIMYLSRQCGYDYTSDKSTHIALKDVLCSL